MDLTMRLSYSLHQPTSKAAKCAALTGLLANTTAAYMELLTSLAKARDARLFQLCR